MINQADAHKRGSSSRSKGKRSELELMHILRDTYGYPVRRGYVFHHESDLVGLEGIHVEVKRVERLNLKKAIEQAVSEAKKRRDGVPCVFHRQDHKKWLVTMQYTAWERFLDQSDTEAYIVYEFRKRFNLYDTVTMVELSAPEGLLTALVHGDLVTMTLVDWIDMYGAWLDNR